MTCHYGYMNTQKQPDIGGTNTMKKQLETLKQALLDLDKDIEIQELKQEIEMRNMYSERFRLQTKIIKETMQNKGANKNENG